MASGSRLLAVFALGLVAVGCAGLGPMRDRGSTNMVRFCDQELERVRASSLQNSKRTKILYFMQLATYENACRDFAASSQNFAIAKQIARDQYGVSISEETTKFLINDASGDYRALNYERAFFRIYNAINYVVQGNLEEALVEARQIDFLLSQLNREQGGKNVYSEDAFARFMTGMLYQENGDVDNANVSYLKALKAYKDSLADYGVPVPVQLLAAAMEVAKKHSPQAVERVSAFGSATPRTLPPGAGEVVVLHQVGLLPEKAEERFTMAYGDGVAYLNKSDSNDLDAQGQRAVDISAMIPASDVITVAFPKFVTRTYGVTDLSVSVDGAISRTRPTLVENVGRIAVKDLDDHKARIYAKTIARAAFYYTLQKLIEKELRDAGKNEFVIQIAVTAEKLRQALFEKADIRQWESLPDKFKMSTIVLPAGQHTLMIRRKGEATLDPSIPALGDIVVTVSEGKRTFVTVRTAS